MKPYYTDDRAIRSELAGKDLACWCPLSSPCHTRAAHAAEIASVKRSRWSRHYQRIAERRIREAQGQAVTRGSQPALDFGGEAS